MNYQPNKTRQDIDNNSLNCAFSSYMNAAMQQGVKAAEKLLPPHSQRKMCSNSEDSLLSCWAFLDTVHETYDFLDKLAAGNLSAKLSQNNRMAQPAKDLQNSLRQLSRQVEQIAKGELNQPFQFIGDFSESFNTLVDRLRFRTELERKIPST